MRALIVDDDPSIASVVQSVLQDEGFDVVPASDGMVALALLADEQFDVILLDLSMPRMDGRTFFRRLRSLPDPTPVLILSAHDALSARAELGADDALAKPFDLDVLVERTRRLASGAQTRAS
jgi:DNA-binding response OmpR family regulator